jgi:hypothetical protein
VSPTAGDIVCDTGFDQLTAHDPNLWLPRSTALAEPAPGDRDLFRAGTRALIDRAETVLCGQLRPTAAVVDVESTHEHRLARSIIQLFNEALARRAEVSRLKAAQVGQNTRFSMLAAVTAASERTEQRKYGHGVANPRLQLTQSALSTRCEYLTRSGRTNR